MAAQRILDVGQCCVDGPRIKRFLRERLGLQVDQADTKEEAVSQVEQHQYGLVLVNRILNADRSPGMDVIRAILKMKPETKVMLVSDYPDAQEAAMALGAMAGFGKSAMETEETERLLEEALRGNK